MVAHIHRESDLLTYSIWEKWVIFHSHFNLSRTTDLLRFAPINLHTGTFQWKNYRLSCRKWGCKTKSFHNSIMTMNWGRGGYFLSLNHQYSNQSLGAPDRFDFTNNVTLGKWTIKSKATDVLDTNLINNSWYDGGIRIEVGWNYIR